MSTPSPADPADLAEASSLLRAYFAPGRMQDLARLAAAELDRRGERITAALALHSREEMGERVVCGWCRDSSEEPWEYPCPTVRALGDPDTGSES